MYFQRVFATQVSTGSITQGQQTIYLIKIIYGTVQNKINVFEKPFDARAKAFQKPLAISIFIHQNDRVLELTTTLVAKEEMLKDLETQLEMAKSGSGDVSQVKLYSFKLLPTRLVQPW